MTVTEFLQARIDEDEAGARGELEMEPQSRLGAQWLGLMHQTLAECEAKQHVLDEALVWGEGCLNVMTWYLAEIYSDHPDYREEWRP